MLLLRTPIGYTFIHIKKSDKQNRPKQISKGTHIINKLQSNKLSIKNEHAKKKRIFFSKSLDFSIYIIFRFKIFRFIFLFMNSKKNKQLNLITSDI